MVGQANDPLEHEADRVADQVLRMPDRDLSITPATAQLSRKCEACEEDAAAFESICGSVNTTAEHSILQTALGPREKELSSATQRDRVHKALFIVIDTPKLPPGTAQVKVGAPAPPSDPLAARRVQCSGHRRVGRDRMRSFPGRNDTSTDACKSQFQHDYRGDKFCFRWIALSTSS